MRIKSRRPPASTSAIRWSATCFALLLIVLILAATIAQAANDERAPGLGADVTDVSLPVTNPGIADQLPHTDLTRSEAVALDEGVFEPLLTAPAGIFEDLDVVRFVSDHAAIVPTEQEPPALAIGPPGKAESPRALLESTVPLRTDGETVDLTLQRSNETFHPQTPLVDVNIPTDLGDGILLPSSDVRIDLPAAPAEVSPTITSGTTALYPNVADDTDFVVAPTPTGVETFSILRSPEAPRSHTLDLDLPPGAELSATQGGAVVRDNGETLMSVLPPTAYDADGELVPVSLTVAGNSLELTADPGPTTSWPVIVDPILEIYTWWSSGSSAGWNDWTATVNPSGPMGAGFANGSVSGHAFWYVISQPGSYSPGQGASISHAVPRFAKEMSEGHKPTSWIVSMQLGNVSAVTSAGTSSPYPLAEIRRSDNATWAGTSPYFAVWGYPGNAPAFSSGSVGMSTGNDHDAKIAYAAALGVNESASASGERMMAVGNVTLETTDDDYPEIVNPLASELWANGTAKEAITTTVKDPGLGAKTATFALPTTTGSTKATVTHSCTGTSANPCPSSWPTSLGTGQYNPASMPQGENRIPIFATDVLGHVSTVAKAQINVDHTAPRLAVSGTLTEQATLGTNLSEYKLKYDATDGDKAPAEALPAIGTAGTGTGQVQRPMGVALDAAGNVWVVDRENNKVLKYDKNGAYQMQFGSAGSGNGQFNDPRGIAVNPKTGNLWVTEVGGKRIQEFKPSGEFVRKITTPPFGSFSIPYGIAAGADGTVWIVDQGSKMVWMYNELGQALGYANGTAAAPSSVSLPDLSAPVGVAVDAYGNAWVTDAGLNRVTQYGKAHGEWLSQFGSTGSSDGQLSSPGGIAVGPSGGIFVSDGGNNRIQQFKTDGSLTRKLGSTGTGLGQLSEPRGMAVAKDGTVLVADANNKRVARWAHGDLNPQSGVVKVEVKVDEQTKPEAGEAKACASTCAMSKEWTLDADDYSIGTHKVEVIATDGVDLKSETAILNIETHGDRKDPTIALSGSMTEQASLGTTRPSYTLAVNATDPGEANERKSGVVDVKVKVDGAQVKASSAACPAGGCSLATEWTLNNLSYSAGSHNVEVIATDGAGRSSNKSLTINIARDTTAPTITASNAFYNAPEGWVEQKSYSVMATGQDATGFGVTSMTLKIDGEVVRSKSQECSQGGCGLLAWLSQPLNMAAYEGGAHAAELLVVDGAGNVAKKAWTINVDPTGAIPADEATQTLEAMEETVPAEHDFKPVASTSEVLEPEVIEAGDNPHFVEVEGEFKSTGVTTRTEIDPGSEVITIEGTEGPIELVPEVETSTPEISKGSAVVLPGSGADTVVRPDYNGSQMFTTIREESAPEEFGWHIKMGLGQYLDQIDPQHIAINFSNDEQAWLISAEPAHDATGAAVATTLEIDGPSDVTLTVEHRGKGAIYPVSAGQSYETGYATVTFVLPSPPPPNEEEAGDGVEFAYNEDLGPLSLEEQEDVTEWLGGTKPRREKNKPVHLKQAKRLARNVIHGKVPPPSYARTGGPPGSGHGEWEEAQRITAYTCASFFDGCDIWKTQFEKWDGPSSYFNQHYKWKGGQWVPSYVSTGPVNCSSHVEWWWSLNLAIDIVGCDTHKPYVAEVGSGSKLTYFVKYDLEILYVPELPGEIAEEYTTLINQVFPNGYQRAVIKTRHSNILTM